MPSSRRSRDLSVSRRCGEISRPPEPFSAVYPSSPDQVVDLAQERRQHFGPGFVDRDHIAVAYAPIPLDIDGRLDIEGHAGLQYVRGSWMEARREFAADGGESHVVADG